MKKLIIRALAGLLASVLLVAGVALVGNMPTASVPTAYFIRPAAFIRTPP